MILLDTNVVSELMRVDPNTRVVAWVDAQIAESLWLPAVALAELLYGIGRLADGQRKAVLAETLDAMVHEEFDHRVAPFDETAAAHYADIVVTRDRSGRPISAADAQIGAIVRSHQATLVTRNVDDFTGVGIEVVNPWNHTGE